MIIRVIFMRTKYNGLDLFTSFRVALDQKSYKKNYVDNNMYSLLQGIKKKLIK